MNDSLAIIDISRLLRLLRYPSGRAKALGVRHFRPNCTNWLVLCPATLHRKGGCPVHQLARSWLLERLTRSSSTVISKSKQRASQTFLPWLPANNSYRSLAKTLNLQKVLKFDSCTYI